MTIQTIIQAAGIALLAGDKVLLLKRGDGGDYPGHWGLPAGKVEMDESPEMAARRETLEECGFAITGALRQIAFTDSGTVQFTTFARNVQQFEPVLCSESTESVWATLDDLPSPMHPGAQLMLESGALDQIDISKLNETEVARLMSTGELDSPVRFGAMMLWAMRITGTGTAYRSAINEFVYRPPEHYMTQEFLDRCNGLAVIFEHPEKRTLNSEEFSDRVIGSIMLPYLQPEIAEVWGIAKVYDDTANLLMLEKKMSTSPTVYFRNMADNSTIKLDNGESILIEGNPSLLDHLAVCEQGVWDKGGEPAGILTSTTGAAIMTDAEIKAKADADEKAKADADEKAKADADEKAEMKARMDAMQARMDAMEKDMPAPKMAAADSEEEEKKKADAEAKEKADAEEEEAKKAKADSVETQRRIADMEARMPKVLCDADIAKIAQTQSMADSVARAFGDTAAAPIAGEGVSGYRKRMLQKFQPHSQAWKDVPLSAMSDAVLDIAEKQIYADASAAARSPLLNVGPGLREIVSNSRAGHHISTFVGKVSDFTGQFKSPVRKFVTQFNKPAA